MPLRLSPALIAGLAALALTGCAHRPAGDVAALARAPAAAAGRVILLRGWNDLSPGIDPLAGKIRAAGCEAAVFRHGQWRDLIAPLAGPRPGPLILIGHSFGGDAALELAAELGRAGAAVDLVVTLDPCWPPPVPAGVRVCRNYYLSRGLRGVLPFFRGVSLDLGANSGAALTNLDLNGSHAELREPDTDHFTLTTNPHVHAAILADIAAVVAAPAAAAR